MSRKMPPPNPAQGKLTDLRWRVLEYAKTSPDMILEALSGIDEDMRGVFYEIASGNPSTPAEALDMMADHPGSDAQYRIAVHPNTTTETLEKIAANPSREGAGEIAQARLIYQRACERLWKPETYETIEICFDRPHAEYGIGYYPKRGYGVAAETPEMRAENEQILQEMRDAKR